MERGYVEGFMRHRVIYAKTIIFKYPFYVVLPF